MRGGGRVASLAVSIEPPWVRHRATLAQPLFQDSPLTYRAGSLRVAERVYMQAHNVLASALLLATSSRVTRSSQALFSVTP